MPVYNNVHNDQGLETMDERVLWAWNGHLECMHKPNMQRQVYTSSTVATGRFFDMCSLFHIITSSWHLCQPSSCLGPVQLERCTSTMYDHDDVLMRMKDLLGTPMLVSKVYFPRRF